jgi:hypothetical protein
MENALVLISVPNWLFSFFDEFKDNDPPNTLSPLLNCPKDWMKAARKIAD